MRKMRCFLFSAASLILSFATLSAEEVNKTFEITSDYKALNVSGALTVTYSSEAEVVTVYADSQDIENVEFKCEEGTVTVSLKEKKLLRFAKVASPVRVEIPASSSLAILNVTGASKFVSDAVVDVIDLSLDVSGASTFTAEVSAVDMDLFVSGASSVNITGEAEEVSYNVSGASRVGSDDGWLKSDEAKVSVSGASRLWLEAEDSISGHVSGASRVIYSGECNVSVGVTGASACNRK